MGVALGEWPFAVVSWRWSGSRRERTLVLVNLCGEWPLLRVELCRATLLVAGLSRGEDARLGSSPYTRRPRRMVERKAFCAAPDIRNRLAVLGVFTSEENVARRAVARTWLTAANQAGAAVLSRFVARGMGDTPALSQESRDDGDVVFLRAPTTMLRSNGPLLTLILWFECSLQAWPHAKLIGKADDDVWVHVDATTAHLQGSLEALRPVLRVGDGEVPLMFWGLMETYGWSLTSHRPMGFVYKYGSYPPTCSVKRLPSARDKLNHTFISPVHFAKGPMYFVSSPLVAQLSSSREFREYAMVTIASANGTRREKTMPWEDAFTGLSILRHVSGVRAAYVHMGSRIFSEAFGVYSKFGFSQNTILYHANTAKARAPARYNAMHYWAMDNHCRALGGPLRATLRCDTEELTTCTGAKWKRCLYVHNYSKCSSNGNKWSSKVQRSNRTSTHSIAISDNVAIASQSMAGSRRLHSLGHVHTNS